MPSADERENKYIRKKLTIHCIRQLKCDAYMLQLTRIKIFI